MDLCTYYLANLPVIQLKDHLAGIVKQNGGNLYMSSPPLFYAEKKIRSLNLLRQNALHTLAQLNTSPTNSTDEQRMTWMLWTVWRK